MKETGTKGDIIYKDSLFHPRYLGRLNNIISESAKSEINAPTNKLQSLLTAHYVVDHYMPYATMWSTILISEDHPNIGRMHNQHAEAHFHTVKEMVLENHNDMSVGRVVKRLKHYSTSLRKSL